MPAKPPVVTIASDLAEVRHVVDQIEEALVACRFTEHDVFSIKLELEEFRNAIINDTKTIVSEIDGMMAMDVAHQILEKIGKANRN